MPCIGLGFQEVRVGRTSSMPSASCSAGRGLSVHQTATAVHSLLVELDLEVEAGSGPAEGSWSMLGTAAAFAAASSAGAASASDVTSLSAILRILRSSPASVRIVSHALLASTISPQRPSESCTREPTPISEGCWSMSFDTRSSGGGGAGSGGGTGGGCGAGGGGVRPLR